MNIKSIINLFRVSKNAAKPISRGKDIVSHIGYQTKPIGDTFLSTTSQKVTFWDVKKLFNGGKIEGGHLYDEMYKIKAGMFFDSLTSIKSFKKWLHSVSLNKTLKYRDYEEIIDFMNLHNGKYIDVWKGFSKTDEIPNIQKLALFVRSIRRIDRLEMYKNMSPKEWETCIDGIINKPREVVGALMRYKYDSRKINGMITSGIGTDKTRKDIQVIEKFIDTQRIKSDLNVFRGEGGFGLFSNVKLRNGKRLNKELEEFTKKIEQGKCS